MARRIVQRALVHTSSLLTLLIALGLLFAAGFVAAARSHLPSANFYGLGPGTTILLLAITGGVLGIAGIVGRLLGVGPGLEDDGIRHGGPPADRR
ncbi:MAG TPA: hypothetical protein VFD32_03635 [Dehalococcoidia bacterium]|nr:hypothetical protein [Dehalococcoidia bacterium]